MSDLGDRLRQLADHADESGAFGIALVLVGHRICQIQIPDEEWVRNDPERAAMNAGLAIYQATNMKQPGANEELGR